MTRQSEAPGLEPGQCAHATKILAAACVPLHYRLAYHSSFLQLCPVHFIHSAPFALSKLCV
eukprot:scaffold316384_cov15-Tisochrysis_lutea.AAC.1